MPVIGRVDLSGVIFLDTSYVDPLTGATFPEYRAERARITELWVPHFGLEPPRSLPDALSLVYGVPASGGLPARRDTANPQPVPGHIPVARGTVALVDKLTAAADVSPRIGPDENS
ncbi:hypothetical protein [Rhodococcus tibetensis]|uniref:Uncharacterized protein n=1 Tax=Rhodococcus tibetensis TaxID=2965064 RepID=A0ABT1QE10_9NOCA|nr:hypothetical protein [Rhodococcus sp. FXJ9.536]MCQ4120442.1 hypothetical protein [Rhodococcus sp. FXJ9.536]